MRHEIMFINREVSTADLLLFLGPFDDDDGPSVSIETGWTMAHVMHRAGVFTSVKEAKNNGWNKPIPPGYDEVLVKKKGLMIYTMTQFVFEDKS